MNTLEEATRLEKSEIVIIIFYIINGILDITMAITTKNATWIICGLLWITLAITRYCDLKIIKGKEEIISLQEKHTQLQEIIIGTLMNETAVEVEISKIKIPKHFTKPNPKKLHKKFKYYREHHKFESKIIINTDYNLLDGYTSYLIAKNYNKTTVIVKLKRKMKEVRK